MASHVYHQSAMDYSVGISELRSELDTWQENFKQGTGSILAVRAGTYMKGSFAVQVRYAFVYGSTVTLDWFYFVERVTRNLGATQYTDHLFDLWVIGPISMENSITLPKLTWFRFDRGCMNYIQLANMQSIPTRTSISTTDTTR